MTLNLIDVDAVRMDGVASLSCTPSAQVARCDPGLVDLFEHVTDAVHVADGAGRVLHQNRRLTRLLDEESDACRILDELRRIASHLSSRAAQLRCGFRSDSLSCGAGGSAWCEIRTDSALYRLHGTILDSHSPSTPPLVVIVIAILDDSGAPSADHLHTRYGLSPREVEVARLLADGLSTRELSAALRVSSHTARHHTENVLRKLRVKRRAEVGRRLRGA